MRSLVLLLSFGTGVAAALLPGPGRADIPRPDPTPDAHCTLDEQCKSGTLCPYAFNPSSTDGEKAKIGETGTWSPGRSRATRSGVNPSLALAP